MMNLPATLFAFDESRRIACGPYGEVHNKVSAYLRDRPMAQPLVFDADTGRQVDLDFRSGTQQAGMPVGSPALAESPRPGKGRPKLGVVAREVTLLPRHWDWLAAQPGGASVTLRKLIEHAARDPDSKEQRQARTNAAYQFMHAVAGNLPGFEEAARALFAGNLAALELGMTAWPADIRAQVLELLKPRPQTWPS